MRLPHPIIVLVAAVLVAAAFTWVLPAGEFDRRTDQVTGRRVVVAGTYHRVPAAPVGPFGAGVAIARGVVSASDVIAVILFVGGTWVVVERLGTLAAVVDGLVGAFAAQGLWVVPIVSLFFAAMGALENMEEEIIPLIPALLALGAAIGVDPVVVVAMSAGAAMVGSAFGPTNPFQAGIALRLAQMPLLSAAGLRLVMFAAGVTVWIAWTMRYARRTRVNVSTGPSRPRTATTSRHILVLVVALAPMAAYVVGALRFDWGLEELAGAFLVGGTVAGFVGGLDVGGLLDAYLDGMQALLPASLMVAIARAISLVLESGKVVDTMLHACAQLLGAVPAAVSALLMIPVQALLHIAVPSVSGQAVLTMPLFVPLADVLALSRQVPVLAYQTGGGLMELVTPTNGALMAILLAAGVSYQRWMRFAAGALVLLTLIGAAATIAAIR